MISLVTGGAGFLGSHLCEYLIEKNHEVVCVDNLITGKTSNLERIWDDKNFKFIEHDVTNPFYYGDDIDYVFHLASPASPDDYLKYPIHTLKVGAFGTYHMLGFAKHHKARFLLASTSEVYGDPKVHPQCEEYWGNVNPIGPRSVYDEAKRYAEALTMTYHNVHGLKTRIARIFNTFGSRMRLDDGRAVPNFIGQALRGELLTVYGNGLQTRSFCYVSDMIRGLYLLMMSDYYLPMNLGNPNELTIIEFAKRIKKLTKSKSEIVFLDAKVDDPVQRRPDISKAKKILHWKPEVKLDDGLKKVVDYYVRELGKQGKHHHSSL
jgi:dTDP-glucose 4,6-dehydratase